MWIVLSCIASGVVLFLIKSAFDKFTAIRTITQSGGQVEVEYDSTRSIVLYGLPSASLEKADSYIGWPYWGRVYRVQTGLVNQKVVDAITRLKTVRALSCVDDPTASSTSLLRLAEMRSIEHFYVRVRGTTNDDKLLEIAAKWPRLYTLWLDGAEITDRGLGNCSQMHSLNLLRFNSKRVSDQGIHLLQRCTSLRRFYFSPSLHVSGKAIQELKQALPNLDVIDSY